MFKYNVFGVFEDLILQIEIYSIELLYIYYHPEWTLKNFLGICFF